MIKLGGSYFNECRRLKYVAQDMEEIAGLGADYVLHQLAEIDWELYFENMRGVVRASHDAGLEVWLGQPAIGYVFSASEYSRFVVDHPETAQLDQFSHPLSAACPNHPEFRNFMRRWIDAAIDLGPDSLFWDEPHLFIGSWWGCPDRWGCRCALCQTLYREQFGCGMPTDRNDPSVQAFRSVTMVRFLGDLLSYASAQGIDNTMTVLPKEMSPDTAFLDWETIARLPGLKGLGTDPYPFTESLETAPWVKNGWREFVASNAAGITELCRRNDLENHLWIQGFSVPADDGGYIDNAAQVALAGGITNIAINGFDGNRDMSAQACEKPDEVWKKVRSAFRRIRSAAVS